MIEEQVFGGCTDKVLTFLICLKMWAMTVITTVMTVIGFFLAVNAPLALFCHISSQQKCLQPSAGGCTPALKWWYRGSISVYFKAVNNYVDFYSFIALTVKIWKAGFCHALNTPPLLQSLVEFIPGSFLVTDCHFWIKSCLLSRAPQIWCSWRHLWRGDDGCAWLKLSAHSIAYHRRSLKLCTCRILIIETNDRSLPASPPQSSQETEPSLSGAGLSSALTARHRIL